LKRLSPNERVEDKNEGLYYQVRDMFNDLTDKKYSDALLYFFINKTAYSGMIRYNSKGEFNVPFGRYERLNTSLVTKKHSELLANTEIFNLDYKEIFNMTKSDDFIFLDPPYDCIFSDYGNEEYKDGFNDNCHIALAKDFKNLSCKALLVIGRTPLTERLYKDMVIDEYAKNYSVNIRNRFKSVATHILISNYGTNYKSLFSQQLEYAEAY
jgi:DNA adenine methylase